MEPTTSHDQDSGALVGALPVIREHIVSTPETCGGTPRISGTRIQVKQIVVMHERHPDIAYCPKDSRTLGQIVDSLILIWELLEPDEMVNRVEYI